MATVYLVEDTVLGREAALKVLSDPDPSGALAGRLLAEARLLARLEHPNLAPVHDAGTLPDGRVFYVMKYVRGERLDVWQRGPRRCRSASDSSEDLRCRRLRAREGCGAPRPQAGEHHGRRVRRGAGDGLGCGQGPSLCRRQPTIAVEPGGPPADYARRGDHRHAGLDGARAGARGDRRGRDPNRYPRSGRYPLLPAVRPSPGLRDGPGRGTAPGRRRIPSKLLRRDRFTRDFPGTWRRFASGPWPPLRSRGTRRLPLSPPT